MTSQGSPKRQPGTTKHTAACRAQREFATKRSTGRPPGTSAEPAEPATVGPPNRELLRFRRASCSRSSAPRGARVAAFLLGAACFAGVAEGQRLWSVDEVTVRPRPPVEAAGALPSAATAGAGPLTAEAARIQVTFDYLRLGFGRLELPLADGTVIEAENAVFEDRGNGNFLWTGEVPGAGYESVLFTVHDEHLVGWFGEPGGPKYTVHAGPDGRGTLAVEQGPTGNWCGVMDGRPLAGPAAAATPARDLPDSVAGRSTGSVLDILALYPRRTELWWRVIGGPSVGIQQLEDYLNMVFRNGQIPATANLIPERWDPVWASHPGVGGGHRNNSFWHWEFGSSHDVWRLQERHQADLVHFVPDRGTSYAAGVASLRFSFEPGVYTGWSVPWPPDIFAHEIGHNLGGVHEPATFKDFAEAQAWYAEHFRPYVFGHTDLTSCATREGRGDALYCPSTVMSYGQDLWDDPDRYAVREPFYSSVRHQPNGWTIGVAGTSEVERLFHETVPVAVRSGEAEEPRAQDPRRITARWTDRNTVRVSFALDQRSTAGYVNVGLTGGGSEFYQWAFKHLDTEGGGWKYVVDEEWTDSNVTPLFDPPDEFATPEVTGVDITGLRPGGRYKVSADRSGALSSDVFDLRPPEAAQGAPAAPEHLSAPTTGDDAVRLTWRADGSAPPDGFEVWYRKWSGDEPDEVWRRYEGPLPADARSADVRGLAAEEEVPITDPFWDSERQVWIDRAHALRGRYSLVVVAYNAAGFAASETLDFEFMPGPFPEATPAGELPDCSTWTRSSGLELDGYDVYVCLETPGGERRRAWDYGLSADQSGLLYFFDRDNVELLVKVLDGCAVNGHRWVFVAPVTTLGFRLAIQEWGPYVADRRQSWYYDSKRRPQERIGRNIDDGNPQGSTARTVSDTMAFPCTPAEIAAARAKAAVAEGGHAAFLRSRGLTGAGLASLERRSAGASTDCEPGGTALTLAGGYRVSMCYETYAGDTGDALDWGLDSSQSALLYFFERNNAEVLIKVLDGCGVNGHRWVFVAPVTDLAFNLRVESPDGEVWTHTNRLGQTADAASDTSAFGCTA